MSSFSLSPQREMRWMEGGRGEVWREGGERGGVEEAGSQGVRGIPAALWVDLLFFSCSPTGDVPAVRQTSTNQSSSGPNLCI